MPDYVLLRRDENQARGLAQYALDFLVAREDSLDERVRRAVVQFHRDSVACAVAALAAGTNAPRVLREEALQYATVPPTPGVACFGSRTPVAVERAVAANCAAVRELDANGTNFGYNPQRGDVRGEFGHNDFYPVAVAGAQLAGCDGRQLLRAMLCLDEIRGRLAEVFGLKDHKIDHVLHGAIASAAVYGALRGGSVDQIESAIGLVVAHYVPFRAIRAGHQLSDSKGASAALSTEMAVTSVHRALRGFRGPADIFRNPQAVFCLFEPPAEPDTSPFDLHLARGGGDFAVTGMHFKLGLYEHQSAGAIQGLIDLLQKYPRAVAEAEAIERIRITIYEPAFGIIGDPAKRDPRTRQSADHSMVYIIATLVRKALQTQARDWPELMLTLQDYEPPALFDPLTRRLMDRIEFVHGGAEFDRLYPDGIPTALEIQHRELGRLESGLVMYPLGHARNPSDRLQSLLDHKFRLLVGEHVPSAEPLRDSLDQLEQLSVDQVRQLYSFPIQGLETSAPNGER